MCVSFALSVLLAFPGALGLRFLRGGEPESGLQVTLEGSGIALEGKTREDGFLRFLGVPPGAYVLKADSLEWDLVLTSETELLTLDLDGHQIQGIHAGRFGHTTLTGESLSRLPHAGTVSTVLETLEPFAVTDRIDVAGVESATAPLWSVRGSSWTQNQILVDGLDVTDPAGGASLLYPDVAFFEEISLVTSKNPPEAAGPGAELHLVSRAPPSSIEGSFSLRYTGSALQSENLSDELEGFGVEPRQVLRFPSARLEMGGGGVYGAIQGFDLGARLPKFDAEEKTRLLGAAGKLTRERWSLLGIAQRVDRPTYGARPLAEAATAVEATETFRVAQASLDAGGFFFRLGFARGELDSNYSGYSGEGSPLRDLATGELFEAPLLVTDRTRARWTAISARDFLLSGHLLRGGVELSRASETGRESVPGSTQRLMVDGVGHALSSYSGSGEREASATRLALHLKDAFFFHAFRVSPGVRLDLSRSGPIRWGSLSGTVDLGYALTPSSEIHFSLGRYPHVLTTRLRGVEQGLSWMWRRWNDANGDRRPSDDEVGEALRRGGGGYTSIEDDLPRPYTHELTIGIEKHFGRGFLRFSGYQRWEKRLLQTVNVGIAPESYESFLFHDVGVDGDLGTEDDREIPIYDQRRQRGEDLFRLTQPPGLESFAQGVDLLLGFDHGRVSWQLSGRAYRDVGSGNVGNEPAENDTGIPGDLFDDPNTLTSAEGRLYFDRAFTGKLALTARAPLGIDIGAAIRYWDGQPFTRQIFFEDLGQGFTIVQAYFRGRLRYAFNMTVDVRLEREFPLGRSRLALGLDAFNLFNQTLQTGENVRSGETFREPTFVQPARTLALSARLRF